MVAPGKRRLRPLPAASCLPSRMQRAAVVIWAEAAWSWCACRAERCGSPCPCRLACCEYPKFVAREMAGWSGTSRSCIKKCGWDKATRDLPFYLVGGSWRALARLDMHLTGFPLPVIHHYEMTKETPARLVRVLARTDKAKLKAIPSLDRKSPRLNSSH